MSKKQNNVPSPAIDGNCYTPERLKVAAVDRCYLTAPITVVSLTRDSLSLPRPLTMTPRTLIRTSPWKPRSLRQRTKICCSQWTKDSSRVSLLLIRTLVSSIDQASLWKRTNRTDSSWKQHSITADWKWQHKRIVLPSILDLNSGHSTKSKHNLNL